MPATLGTKIIPIGQMRAAIWASWPAPLGMRTRVRFKPSAARRIGRDLKPADRTDLTARLAPDDLIHGYRQVRGGQERVGAFGHRSGPGMIGEPLDRDVVPVDRHDALDHAE